MVNVSCETKTVSKIVYEEEKLYYYLESDLYSNWSEPEIWNNISDVKNKNVKKTNRT